MSFEINLKSCHPCDDISNSNDNCDKVYTKRWLILFLFTSVSLINSAQVGEYVIITNLLKRLYNVSTETITYTGTIYSIVGVVCFIPTSYFQRIWGLRISVLITMGVTAVGSWIKWFGVILDNIYVVFLGQALCGIGYVYVLTLPPQIALNWFPKKSTNLAISISYFGQNFGVGLFLFIVPTILQKHPNILKYPNEFYALHLCVAVLCVCLFVMIMLFFEEQPPTPPSQSRLNQMKAKGTFNVKYYWQSIRKCLTNMWYIYLTISVGLAMACLACFINILNPIVLFHFKGIEEGIGITCLVMQTVGSALGIVFCKLMDITTEIKIFHVFSIFMGWIVYILFVIALYYNDLLSVLITLCLAGIFLNCAQSTAFVFCAEIMYPEVEISANLLNGMINLLTFIINAVSSILFKEYGDLSLNLFVAACITISLSLTYTIPDIRNRQKGQID